MEETLRNMLDETGSAGLKNGNADSEEEGDSNYDINSDMDLGDVVFVDALDADTFRAKATGEEGPDFTDPNYVDGRVKNPKFPGYVSSDSPKLYKNKLLGFVS